jgi:hypothetical protein
VQKCHNLGLDPGQSQVFVKKKKAVYIIWLGLRPQRRWRWRCQFCACWPLRLRRAGARGGVGCFNHNWRVVEVCDERGRCQWRCFLGMSGVPGPGGNGTHAMPPHAVYLPGSGPGRASWQNQHKDIFGIRWERRLSAELGMCHQFFPPPHRKRLLLPSQDKNYWNNPRWDGPGI